MFPALIAGGLGLLGGILTNRSSAKQAQINRDFQEEMSNTSYQRAVSDLRAAGLNPMLAAKTGGASTPTGAVAPVSDVVESGMSSARQSLGMRQATASVENLEASARKLDAETAKVKSETMTEDMNRSMFFARRENLVQGTSLGLQRQLSESTRNALLNQQVLTEAQKTELTRYLAGKAGVDFDVASTTFSADVARRKAESELKQLAIPAAKAEAQFYGDLGQANPYLRQILEVIKTIFNARRGQ